MILRGAGWLSLQRLQAAALVAAAGLLLGGCASDDQDAVGPADESSPASPSSTSAPSDPPSASGIDLAESCPQMARGLPQGFLPPAPRWQQYADELEGIREAGGLETQEVVDVLLSPVQELADDPRAPQPYVVAQRELTRALDTVGQRCADAGSNAFE